MNEPIESDYCIIEIKGSVLQVLCSAVTVCQFFIHTALFTWMLVEGINLYIKLVKVFSVKRKYVAYLAMGWGELQIPIIYFDDILIFLLNNS